LKFIFEILAPGPDSGAGFDWPDGGEKINGVALNKFSSLI